MDTDTITKPPEGFVLDEPVAPPEGFVLDEPEPEPEPKPKQFDDIVGPFEGRRQKVNSYLRGDTSLSEEFAHSLFMPSPGGTYGLDDSELAPGYEGMIKDYEDVVVNTLGLAQQINADDEMVEMIFDNHDAIMEANFGETKISPAIARKYLAEQTDLRNRKTPVPKEPWYRKYFGTVDDWQTVLEALKKGSPYEDETEPGYYDAFKWLTTYTMSLGGVLGPKDLREELLDEAKKYKGFGEAAGTVTGDSLVTYFEWAVLYPKLIKAAGISGKALENIPQVKKATTAIRKIPALDEFLTKNPRLKALAARMAAAFTKGEIAGQVTAAAELIGDDEPIGTWVVKMNKRGAMIGGISLIFSAAHSYDQYKYIKNTKRFMYKSAYNRHLERVKGGMSEKASMKLAESEGEKIKDIIYYMENEFYGQGTELYGGKKPALSPEQAAKDFYKHGYDVRHGGKTYKRLREIRRAQLKDVLLHPEPKPKASKIAEQPTAYQEIIQTSTGKRVGIAPPGTTAKQLKPGYKLSEPIPFDIAGINIKTATEEEKAAKAMPPAEYAAKIKKMIIPYSEARQRMADQAAEAEEGPEKTKLQQQLDEMDAQAAEHLRSIAQEGRKEEEPTITPEETKITAVKAEGKVTVYHGAKTDIKGELEPDVNGIVWVSRKKEWAKGYGENIVEYSIPNDKILNMDSPEGQAIIDEIGGRSKLGELKAAEKRGYLAIERGNEIATRPKVIQPAPPAKKATEGTEVTEKAKKSEISNLKSEMEAREAGQSDEQLSGITKRRRRSLIKETAEKIKGHDIYQAEIAAQETSARQVGPGFYYVHESGRGEPVLGLSHVGSIRGPSATALTSRAATRSAQTSHVNVLWALVSAARQKPR